MNLAEILTVTHLLLFRRFAEVHFELVAGHNLITIVIHTEQDVVVVSFFREALLLAQVQEGHAVGFYPNRQPFRVCDAIALRGTTASGSEGP